MASGREDAGAEPTSAGYVFPDAWLAWYEAQFARVIAADPSADVLEPERVRPLVEWWARTRSGEPPRPRVRSGEHYYLDQIAAEWAGVRLGDARELVRSYPPGELPASPHQSTRRAGDGSRPIRQGKPSTATRRAAERTIADALAAPTDRMLAAAAVVAVLELADELGVSLRRPGRGDIGLEGALVEAIGIAVKLHEGGHRFWRNMREQPRCTRCNRSAKTAERCGVLRRTQTQKDRVDCVLEQLLGVPAPTLRKS